ncbi:MAG: phosphoadenosine phosphosulfate reductase [Deinococcus-Thermus bacterium]|jgi:hypothetical protein|nr:phosphoadenosine phosphosulfate reductase [Deinococcota bacterium]
MTGTTSEASRAWLDRLDAHAMEHGFHARLGSRHGALYTEDDPEVLLVTFENAETIRDERDPPLPAGLSLAGREGWSQLCVYSEGTTWFRDPEVFALFDDLVDDGFFDLFDRVVFHGAGPEGYAACAFSVVAPGATVLAIRPQATLDPARAIWDRRYPEARRLDFRGRYGYAPEMAEAAETVALLYDPLVDEDAMHAALFGPEALHFRVPHLGPRTEREIASMGALRPLVRDAGRGRLDARAFARVWRKRHRHRPYLRHVLSALEDADRPWLKGLWCRSALEADDRPSFRKGLREAEAALAAEGRALPPAGGGAEDRTSRAG